jgi:hypothetical protein
MKEASQHAAFDGLSAFQHGGCAALSANKPAGRAQAKADMLTSEARKG